MEAYLGLLQLASKQDLLNDLVIVLGAEVTLLGTVGRLIVGALCAVPEWIEVQRSVSCPLLTTCISLDWNEFEEENSLVGDKDLECLDNVDQSRLGHRLVGLGLLERLERLDILDEDDVVLARLLALVVDLGLLSAALHLGCLLVVVVGGWWLVVDGW